MKIEFMEQQKQVCIWLTREESADEEIQKKMWQLLEPLREKQFFFTIYRSGTQDLTILGQAGSYAETYANEHGFGFMPVVE